MRRFGDYELLEEIARGGMGVVFKARQASLNRIVAVKMILAGQLAGEAEVQRFRAEAESAAQLQHPNIVAIHEVGVLEGQHYFSMDFVEGQNLTEYVRNRPLSSRQAAKYLKTIAEAIHYAHQHGILHRDLKPSNILMDQSDQPRVSDFGLARQIKGDSDLTLSGQVLGSPNFMPPEQAAGKRSQVGPHSDVYSLGAILYYLLTARAPFAAETMTETLQQVVHNDPPSPRLLNPGMSRDLETICLKCLEKEPGKRYATAQELADELGRFLTDEPIRARPVGPADKTWRWCRRKPALSSALVVVLVLVLVLSVGSPIAVLRINRARLQAQTKAKEATDSLWYSYLAQARAGRWSGRAGRRFESLEALRKAAELRPAPELRNEAIACMALADIRIARELFDIPAGVAWRPDGDYQRYALAEDKGISVRRLSDGRELMLLTGSEPPLHGLWFSPNGRYLDVRFGTEPYRLRVWDLDRGDGYQIAANRSVRNIAFSHSSRTVAVAVDGAVLIYDLVSRQMLKSLAQPGLPWFLVFDAKDERLAVANAEGLEVRILDVETGQILQTLAHPATVRMVAWHPDGQLLASACDDMQAYVWDTFTGKKRAALSGHQAEVIGVEFSHGGDLLASRSWDGTYRLWDPLAGRQLVAVPTTALGHFSPGDDYEIGGVSDGKQTKLVRWEVATGRECRVLHSDLEPYKGPRSCSFSPDGRWLASGHSDGVRLWDVQTAKQIVFLPEGTTWSVMFEPSGRGFITSGESGLKRWPVEYQQTDQSVLLRIGPAGRFDLAGSSRRACLSLDGRTLAILHSDRVHVLDVPTWREKVELRGSSREGYVALSPDGKWGATGFWEAGKPNQIWDLQTGSLVLELPDEQCTVTFSPDSQWLVTSTPSECHFWQVGSWKRLHSIPRGGAAELTGSVAFTPDGRMVAIAHTRRSVRLVNTGTWQELATLEAPDPGVLSDLKFSPDGALLAAATENRVLHLWDLRSIRQQLAAMKLDWDLPPLPPPATNQFQEPLTVIVLGNTNQPGTERKP